MTTQSKKFAKNYEILEQINEKLQDNQDTPTLLDELAPMLEQASKSYKLCKERIDAAQKFIDEFDKQD
ncbi:MULTISPECIES: exodeoxyribonuclease VII small subunit [unclassified Francisella]|uniref:exodeoxyribonuclease VII small subunit n=1 Tax=unclassified Francisella TaxID=2610885 RepID=UPI002E2FD1A5|nr:MULTISPECIES: exodeoxyribonuclease VII small subunit [unclassified Francisella]MED7820341.1 exodeoxyribonuclease VII small subunit [Francisella sp. 19S2-4]MED7831176.1 exodeoxyribonuclease VII small subunit [Francisella sp. 19S2-10]